MKKIVALCMMIIALGFVAAGCGDKPSTPAAPSNPGPAAPADPVDPPADDS
jgi:ABC-type glycerol-3-phosphate transport system substrate-binding protein